ncbi:MAG: CBS domain-containing protein, partial [Acidimicrobiia bacterium]
SPDGLLGAPANEFVASFLGRERGLRRLALRTVADIETIDSPTVPPDTVRGDALATMEREGSTWVAIVRDGRLEGWVGRRAVEALGPHDPVGGLDLQRFVARVTSDTPLRQALDVIVTSHSRIAAVVDDQDGFHGMITIDQVAGGLDDWVG